MLTIEVLRDAKKDIRMSLRLLFSLGCALAVAESVAGDPAASEQARALVSTMGLDRSALLGMRLAIEDGVKNGKASPALLECAQKIDSSVLIEVFVGELQAALTPSEMRTAQAFYASPAGQKSVEAGLQQIYEISGRPPSGPALIFTSAEAQENDAFSRTAAGEKLIVRQVLGTRRVTDAVQNRIGTVLSACMKSR